jgi:hypothetical protein
LMALLLQLKQLQLLKLHQQVTNLTIRNC